MDVGGRFLLNIFFRKERFPENTDIETPIWAITFFLRKKKHAKNSARVLGPSLGRVKWFVEKSFW